MTKSSRKWSCHEDSNMTFVKSLAQCLIGAQKKKKKSAVRDYINFLISLKSFQNKIQTNNIMLKPLQLGSAIAPAISVYLHGRL